MDANRILQARIAFPFRPFTMVMTDGRHLKIEKPYHLMISTDRRVVVRLTEADHYEALSSNQIRDIEFPEQDQEKQRIA